MKEADDAIYQRRKSAVEQERTIQEAELQTEIAMQSKRQEMAEAEIDNQRALTRKQAEAQAEQLAADIDAEEKRKALVELAQANQKIETDGEAYGIELCAKAAASVPVEYVKAMSMAKMDSQQLFALAMDTFAQNAEKINTLNLGSQEIALLKAHGAQGLD